MKWWGFSSGFYHIIHVFRVRRMYIDSLAIFKGRMIVFVHKQSFICLQIHILVH